MSSPLFQSRARLSHKVVQQSGHFVADRGNDCLLRILRYVFSALALFFATYGLITDDLRLSPYMILFLGLMMLVMGLEEFQRKRKVWGAVYVVVFLFVLYGSIQAFTLLN